MITQSFGRRQNFAHRKAAQFFLAALIFALPMSGAVAFQASMDDNAERAGILTKDIRAVPGPKRTIAVRRFSNSGAFRNYYGDWDVGAGLEAMLTTALIESDRFNVIERANLSDVLTEQELVASGMTGAGEDVRVGELNSAQLLIYGAVTEFDTRDKSRGFNLGMAVNGKTLGLGRSKAEGTVGMDIRIVDASTGQILNSVHVQESMTAKGFDISAGYRGMALGDNNFVKTPLGQAARAAITEAVELIAREASKTEWVGQVVDFDRHDVYINAGSNSGITEGDEFFIEKIIRRLTDPTTGEVLMLKTDRVGTVRVASVSEKISFGHYESVSQHLPTRGDLAVLPLD